MLGLGMGMPVAGGGLGPELITNGSFTTDTSWTKGTGWTISGGTANADGTGSFTEISQVIAGLVIGAVYRVTIDVVTYTSGNGAVRVGGIDAIVSPAILSPGTKTADITYTGITNTALITMNPIVATFDNFSVRQVL